MAKRQRVAAEEASGGETSGAQAVKKAKTKPPKAVVPAAKTSAQKGTKTAGHTIRELMFEKRGFVLFIDPNRPSPYRVSPYVEGAEHSEFLVRTTWTSPLANPYRFDHRDGAVPEAYATDPAQMFIDDGLLERLSVSEYTKVYSSFVDTLRQGVRVDTDYGCWIPSDGQISNNLHREMFGAVYGLQTTKPGDGGMFHNLSASSADAFKAFPAGAKHYYSSYITAGRHPCQMVPEISHLCHNPFCMRPDHIIIELKIRNEARKKCRGLAADSICSCTKAYSSTVGSGAFATSFLKAISCKRNPAETESLLRSAGGALIRSYPDPWVEKCCPTPHASIVVRDKVARIERWTTAMNVLEKTGYNNLKFPMSFVDWSPADTMVKKQELSGQKSAGAGYHSALKTWASTYVAKTLRRISERFKRAAQAAADAAAHAAQKCVKQEIDQIDEGGGGVSESEIEEHVEIVGVEEQRPAEEEEPVAPTPTKAVRVSAPSPGAVMFVSPPVHGGSKYRIVPEPGGVSSKAFD